MMGRGPGESLRQAFSGIPSCRIIHATYLLIIPASLFRRRIILRACHPARAGEARGVAANPSPSAIRRVPKAWLLAACGLAACHLGSCAPAFAPLDPRGEPAAAGGAVEDETFGYRRWISPDREPEVVVIGIHGFCGASADYQNLGAYLVAHHPQTAVYAYEVRGQGSDPLVERRGDIADPREWYRDLHAFTRLIREQHPRAMVVWYGESMGGLIAAHALCGAAAGDPPCDGLVLSSPVVRFRDNVPGWKRVLVRAAAVVAPRARVSLDTLSGGGELPMTAGSTHAAQAAKNPYHVEFHTLRLTGALVRHVEGMDACAAGIRVPLLLLHGGKDFFNDDADIRRFLARLPPEVPRSHRHYPGAHHLLMYDACREDVFRDVGCWLGRLAGERR